MVGKGFSHKWIEWLMSSVQGGKVSINIYGTVGPYFTTDEPEGPCFGPIFR